MVVSLMELEATDRTLIWPAGQPEVFPFHASSDTVARVAGRARRRRRWDPRPQLDRPRATSFSGVRFCIFIFLDGRRRSLAVIPV
jgi:hypothetical protein